MQEYIPASLEEHRASFIDIMIEDRQEEHLHRYHIATNSSGYIGCLSLLRF